MCALKHTLECAAILAARLNDPNPVTPPEKIRRSGDGRIETELRIREMVQMESNDGRRYERWNQEAEKFAMQEEDFGEHRWLLTLLERVDIMQ